MNYLKYGIFKAPVQVHLSNGFKAKRLLSSWIISSGAAVKMLAKGVFGNTLNKT